MPLPVLHKLDITETREEFIVFYWFLCEPDVMSPHILTMVPIQKISRKVLIKFCALLLHFSNFMLNYFYES